MWASDRISVCVIAGMVMLMVAGVAAGERWIIPVGAAQNRDAWCQSRGKV